MDKNFTYGERCFYKLSTYKLSIDLSGSDGVPAHGRNDGSEKIVTNTSDRSGKSFFNLNRDKMLMDYLAFHQSSNPRIFKSSNPGLT